MTTATKTRRATSRKLAGVELPDCFASATVAAAAREVSKPRARRNARDARRLSDQVTKLLDRGAL